MATPNLRKSRQTPKSRASSDFPHHRIHILFQPNPKKPESSRSLLTRCRPHPPPSPPPPPLLLCQLRQCSPVLNDSWRKINVSSSWAVPSLLPPERDTTSTPGRPISQVRAPLGRERKGGGRRVGSRCRVRARRGHCWRRSRSRSVLSTERCEGEVDGCSLWY